MKFDVENPIVKLCMQGMMLEGEGNREEALCLFQQAWEQATNDFEKFTAAHYIARHHKPGCDKLKWSETALCLALKINDEKMKAVYPSLYLNIGRCFEDMDDFINARKNYKLALSFTDFLKEDGYGRMIRSGIASGMERLTMETDNK